MQLSQTIGDTYCKSQTKNLIQIAYNFELCGIGKYQAKTERFHVRKPGAIKMKNYQSRDSGNLQFSKFVDVKCWGCRV